MEQASRPADWKHFDDFAAGIATNRLAITDALVGESLEITLKNGRAVKLQFVSSHKVKWREGDAAGKEWCEAINVAPDVFFVNMTFSARSDEDEAFIINVKNRRVLSVRERVRAVNEAPGEPRVAQIYTPGFSRGSCPSAVRHRAGAHAGSDRAYRALPIQSAAHL